jgi:hypothetical protein
MEEPMRKTVAIVLSLVFYLANSAAIVQRPVSAATCPPVPTARQQALFDGWNSIAFPVDDANLYLLGVTVGGTWIPLVTVFEMSEPERIALADQWVGEQAGTEELDAYWNALKGCGIASPRPEGAEASSQVGFTSLESDRRCVEYVSNLKSQLRGAALTDGDIETVSSCRYTATGDWFHPSGPDDPRLRTGPILSACEKSTVADERARIDAQIASLEALLANTPNPAVRPGQKPATLLEAAQSISDPNGPRLRVEGASAPLWMDSYYQVLLSFMQDPANVNLLSYAQWSYLRSQSVVTRVQQGVNPYSKQAIGGMLTKTLTTPMDFREEIHIAEYFKWVITSGFVVVPSGESC